MRKKYSAKMIISILIMISVVLSTATFAYWASEVEGTDQTVQSSLNIGSAKAVETMISISPDTLSPYGYLVPTSQLENSIGLCTDTIDFTYLVTWIEQQDVTQINGENIIGAVAIDINYEIYAEDSLTPLDKELYTNIYDLITIIEYESNPSELLLNANNLEIFGFTASLNEPENKTEYEIITKSTILFYFEFTILSASGSTEPLTIYGDTFSEITPNIISDIQDNFEEYGSYGRTWGDYRYTDLGLETETWKTAILHIYYTPSGSSLSLSPEDGYEFTVYNTAGDEFSMKAAYNWNIIYSDLDGNWYFHTISAENEVDISTLVVEAI